jgi:hypothetical protein
MIPKSGHRFSDKIMLKQAGSAGRWDSTGRQIGPDSTPPLSGLPDAAT